ncbi:MAG: hypothetical protein OXF66_07600 [Gammaproteobacteria bacterium]|nr:hypothetical protein [Gammaproteobacteria bacterium]
MAVIAAFASVPLPWPADPAPSTAQYKAAAAALSETASETPTVSEKARIDAIMGLLSAKIERFAPDAPLAAKREAARRYFGYLGGASTGEFESMETDGLKVAFSHDHSRAFRLSGAMGALSAYRVRLAVSTWDDDDD